MGMLDVEACGPWGWSMGWWAMGGGCWVLSGGTGNRVENEKLKLKKNHMSAIMRLVFV